MKLIIKLITCLLITVILFLNSCKKEYSCENCIGKNKPPIANAGKDTTIILPVDSVILDGSASTDDKKIVSYQWTKISGPDTFKIVQPTAARTTVNKLVKGVFEFELKVTDAEGLFSKDTVQITVIAAGSTNHPPVACAGADRTITLPTDTVTLDGSCSTDPDNNITSYLWTKIGGPASLTIANANVVTTLVSNLTEGIYQFELKVIDAGGLFSKDTVQVTVLTAQQGCDALNRATITIQLVPVAAIPTPRYGTTTATAGNKLLLAGGSKTSDVDNPVSDVDIYDFGAQTWSTAHLSTARSAAAVTAGNKIFFVGGVGPGFYGTTRVDIYDASTNTWSLSDLPSPASTVYSYAVVGNKVFFATGGNPGVYGGKVDVYDTSTGLWSEIDLPEQVQSVTATTVGNKVYFAGGVLNPPANNILSVVNIYDNATGTWSTTSSLSQPTEAMAGIYVNGKIYWAGGVIGNDFVNDRSTTTCKVEIRDVTTGSSSFTNLSAPDYFGEPIYYNNKIIFQYWWANPHFDIYDPQSSTWSIGQFPQNVFIESVILVNNGLYAISYNNDSSGSTLPDQIWKLQY